METAKLIAAFKPKQLFLKKNVVVKFIPTKSFKKGFAPNKNIGSTTILTIPTTIINTFPG